MQLSNFGNAVPLVTKPVVQDTEMVGNTATVNTTFSTSISTVPTASGLLAAVADMNLGDAQQASIIPSQNVNTVPIQTSTSLQGINSGNGNILQMLPVELLRGTTDSQVYVLSMTVEDEDINAQEKIHEQVTQSILILNKDLEVEIDLKEHVYRAVNDKIETDGLHDYCKEKHESVSRDKDTPPQTEHIQNNVSELQGKINVDTAPEDIHVEAADEDTSIPNNVEEEKNPCEVLRKD